MTDQIVAEDFIRTGQWVAFAEAVTMLKEYSESRLLYRCKLHDVKSMTLGKTKMIETDSLIAFAEESSIEMTEPAFSKWDMIRTGKWKSVEEAAQYLELTRHQVYYHIRSDNLMAADVDGMVLVSAESLENFDTTTG